MKHVLTMAVAVGALVVAGTAEAASPVGKSYRSDSGRIIKVFNCGGGLGMRIAKAKKKANVGKRIMCGAKKTGANKWSGTILNVDDNKKYTGSATLKGKTLAVSGCVLGGLICSTQNWPQVK